MITDYYCCEINYYNYYFTVIKCDKYNSLSTFGIFFFVKYQLNSLYSITCKNQNAFFKMFCKPNICYDEMEHEYPVYKSWLNLI